LGTLASHHTGLKSEETSVLMKRRVLTLIEMLNRHLHIGESTGHYRSETSKFRHLLNVYCKGNGIDIGCGGDPIGPSAITIDLETPYAVTGNHPLNLGGDARNLYWFKDACLDYVYSSHLLEDFEEKESVLREWIRVLRSGGYLVLLLPDEKRYREYCTMRRLARNPSHKDAEFSLDGLKKVLVAMNLQIIAEFPRLMYEREGSDYNFAVVARKDR